jgi:hypothetical protein
MLKSASSFPKLECRLLPLRDAVGILIVYQAATRYSSIYGLLDEVSYIHDVTQRNHRLFSISMAIPSVSLSPPIHMHKHYVIAVALKTATQDRLQCEDTGDKSEDEHGVESPPLTPPPFTPGIPRYKHL